MPPPMGMRRPGLAVMERPRRPSPEVLEALAAEYETNPHLHELMAWHPEAQTCEDLFDMVCSRNLADMWGVRPWGDILEKIGYLKKLGRIGEGGVEVGGGNEGNEGGMRPLRGLRSETASRAGRSVAGSRRGSVSQRGRGPPGGSSRGPSRRPAQMGPSPLGDE